MPQCYLHGGDSLQNIGGDYYAGQSFIPQTNYTLRHIDINLRDYDGTRSPSIWVYLADANHKPTGDYLSIWRRAYADNWNTYNVFRMRMNMAPLELQTDVEYVIVIHSFALSQASHHQWQYDKDDGAYARGVRLLSVNRGVDWVTKPNDDHIFAVFGSPPVPPPPPPPPTTKWAIIDIEQIVTLTGYKIIVTTNVPCHLYMEWTNHEPEKHKRTTISRGLTVPTASQYCFVDWHENEQSEAGDTIYHTFLKEPWPHCETRWFTFRGKVDNVWCPSVGPIFKKHRTAPTGLTTIFYPHVAPLTDSCDGWTRRYTDTDLTWADVHDGPGDMAQSSAEVTYTDIQAVYTADKWRLIRRILILFNTDEIPAGSTIIEAKLHLYFIDVTNTLHPSSTINVFESWPISTGILVAADYQNVGAVPLSDPKLIDYIPIPGWSIFTLNAAGRNLVIPAGCTKLAIREATFDAPDSQPPWGRIKRSKVQWESADGLYNIPYLEVTYSLP